MWHTMIHGRYGVLSSWCFTCLAKNISCVWQLITIDTKMYVEKATSKFYYTRLDAAFYSIYKNVGQIEFSVIWRLRCELWQEACLSPAFMKSKDGHPLSNLLMRRLWPPLIYRNGANVAMAGGTFLSLKSPYLSGTFKTLCARGPPSPQFTLYLSLHSHRLGAKGLTPRKG